MSGSVYTELTEAPIDVEALRAAAAKPEAGAIAVFCGNVRNHDHGREVLRLEYETHPTAAEILQRCAQTIAAEAAVLHVTLVHRFGSLAVGDIALAVVVAAAHRGEAFASCAAAVDLVKAELPMWKHQFFADGSDEWVNSA